MSYILDIAVILIIFLAATIGAKKGFVKSVIGLVCFLLVIVVSFTFSSKLADIIYSNFAEQRIVSAINTGLDEVGLKTITDSEDSAAQVIETVKTAIEKSTFGLVSVDELSYQNVLSSTQTLSSELAKEITEVFVKPLLLRILETVFTVILLVALSLAIRPVTNLISRIFSFSVIGTLNKLLGFASGAFAGILIAFSVAKLLNQIVTVSASGFLGITADAIEQTHIFSFLLNLF